MNADLKQIKSNEFKIEQLLNSYLLDSSYQSQLLQLLNDQQTLVGAYHSNQSLLKHLKVLQEYQSEYQKLTQLHNRSQLLGTPGRNMSENVKSDHSIPIPNDYYSSETQRLQVNIFITI